MTERAGHVLAEVSHGLGIIVSPLLAKTVLEHIRFLLLPDGRVVVVLKAVRQQMLRPRGWLKMGRQPPREAGNVT